MKYNTLEYGRAVASLLLAGCFCAAFLVRCASINNNLTGGPKDTLPPVILRMDPDNFTTRYPLTGSNRKIYVEFDEFVQLKDQQKEFFTSPQMKKKPQLSIRGKGVVIQIRDTLLENQTYALNFGSALRDNNEGNPLYSMRYVFSTGDEIDSMVCSGYTADSYKADSVSKSYIWFFIADSVEHRAEYDSTLFKYKPSAIARAETNGIFIAQNLKPANYRIYAIEDKNDNQLYDPSVDQVGFLEGVYNPADLPDFAIWYDSVRHYVTAEPQLYFRMFTDKAFRRQTLTQSERPLQHKAMLYFGAAHPDVRKLEFDSIPADRVIYDPQTVGRDTVALWFNLPSAELPDTIRGRITYFKHDSINQLQEVTEELKLSWRFIESKEQQKEREKQERAREKAEAAGEEYVAPEEKNPFAYKIASGEVNPEKHIAIDFDYPLVRFDSTSVSLIQEEADGASQSVAPRFRRDTANLRRWYLEAPWKEASKYKLHIPKGAITDVAGFSNDSIGGNYTTLDPEKFAVVKIDFTPRDDGSAYIVQLLNSSGSLLQERHGAVQLCSAGRDQVPPDRGPQRQRQVGHGQCGGAARARTGRALRRRAGQRHLRHENQLGDRTGDGHESHIRPRDDGDADRDARQARAAATAKGGRRAGQEPRPRTAERRTRPRHFGRFRHGRSLRIGHGSLRQRVPTNH